MLKLFEWDINVPTTITFGSYFAEFVVDEADFNNNYGTSDSFDVFKKNVKSEVIDLIDVSLFGKKMPQQAINFNFDKFIEGHSQFVNKQNLIF